MCLARNAWGHELHCRTARISLAPTQAIDLGAGACQGSADAANGRCVHLLLNEGFRSQLSGLEKAILLIAQGRRTALAAATAASAISAMVQCVMCGKIFC